MRIDSVDIRDFRSIFAESTGASMSIGLAAGMTTLVGQNIWGKSNVLRAVSLALDRRHPTHQPALRSPGKLVNESGELLALADLAWPDGAQPGLTEPVALLLEPNADMEARLGELGYRFFTDKSKLVQYLETLVSADIDGDGVVGETEFGDDPGESATSSRTPLRDIEEFWKLFDSTATLDAAKRVLDGWLDAGHRRRLGPNHLVLQAEGPSRNGVRTVVPIFADGRVLVPFGSYAGQNSDIAIEPLMAASFRSRADELFGFSGSERQARTGRGWLTPDTSEPLLQFCLEIASAYRISMRAAASGTSGEGGPSSR